MSTYYIESDKIKVFPLAKGRVSKALDRGSRLMLENNVANIIRQVIDTDAFIVSPTYDDASSGLFIKDGSTLVLTKPLHLNIYGYSFIIEENVSFFDSITNGPIYAYITLSGNELTAGDTDNKYQGLVLTNELPPENAISLHICTITDTSGNITYTLPAESFIKFSRQSSPAITIIDGKRSL